MIDKVDKRRNQPDHTQGFTRGKKTLLPRPDVDGGGKSYGERKEDDLMDYKDDI